MNRKKFEVHAVDKNGDLWLVSTENLEAAEGIAKQFRDDGYVNVVIKTN